MKSLFLIFLLSFSLYVNAGVESHEFANEQQREDYASLVSELRCLVCQNQTIGDSNAELAADLRRQVYEMLQKGQSKEVILQFMTDRYGDFVLYNPPFKIKTGLLWLGPIAFLVVGLTAVVMVIKRRKANSIKPAQIDDNLAAIRTLLENEDKS